MLESFQMITSKLAIMTIIKSSFSWVCWHGPVIPVTWEAESVVLQVDKDLPGLQSECKSRLGSLVRPGLKIKRAGIVALRSYLAHAKSKTQVEIPRRKIRHIFKAITGIKTNVPAFIWVKVQAVPSCLRPHRILFLHSWSS